MNSFLPVARRPSCVYFHGRAACFGSALLLRWVGRRGCEASSAGVLAERCGHPELLRVAALRALRAQQLAQYMTAEVELACDRGTRAGHTSADICVARAYRPVKRVKKAHNSLSTTAAALDRLLTAVAAKKARLQLATCLLYTSPSPRDGLLSRMPSSA